jgi:pyruvate,water dikinase
MRRQIVEFMPEPLSPLFEDVYVKQGFDHTLDLLLHHMSRLTGENLDTKAMMPHGFAATIHGYAYTCATMKLTPQTGLAILKIYAKLPLYWSAQEFDYHGFVLPNYQALIDKWQQVVDNEKNDYSLLLHGIQELTAADSHYWFGSATHNCSRTIVGARLGMAASVLVGSVCCAQERVALLVVARI